MIKKISNSSTLIGLLFVFCLQNGISQNNLRLLSSNGSSIKVFINQQLINPIAQAEVLVENIKQDTLQIKVEFDNKQFLLGNIFLLNQGKHDVNKEYYYFVSKKANQLQLEFKDMTNIIELPKNYVSKNPLADSVFKTLNPFGHLYELKKEQVLFFNNKPLDGKCLVAMPNNHMAYTEQLLNKASKSEEKLYLALEICKNNCLSTHQLKSLVVLVNNEFDKLLIIKLGYFSLVDTLNKKELMNCFKLEVVKKEFIYFIENLKDFKSLYTGFCRQVSSDTEMNEFVLKQAEASNDSYRIDLLKKNYFRYCFSVQQIKRILEFYIHDREKLQATKLLYYKCAEKDSYISLLNLFSYPQYAKELEDFLKSQNKN